MNTRRLCALGLIALLMMAGSARAQDRRLAEAAQKQDQVALRTLLKSGADVNGAQPEGSTALHWAAHWNLIDAADLLLSAGAKVNQGNRAGVTPLALACENASLAMVERLLKAGANPNAAQTNGETALMTAAQSGNVAVVKSLLAAGANVNATTLARGQTALMWAVAEKHRTVVEALIAGGADMHARSRNGFTALTFAAREGDIAMARILLAAGADVNGDAKDTASTTIEPSDDGAEGTGRAAHPLLIAINSRQIPFAMFLLEQGTNANAATTDGTTALHSAITLSSGLRINEDAYANVGEPEGKLDLIKALVTRGADVNAPLRARRNRSSRGARDPNVWGVGSRQGATPFWLAADAANVNIMRLLLQAGANPRVETEDKTTPLMAAAGLGHAGDRYEVIWTPETALTTVKFLVEEVHVDVNAANEAGFTALHGAAFTGLDAAIPILLAHGANLNAVDFQGRTAYRIAQGHRGGGMSFVERPSTVALLTTLGADTNIGVDPHLAERAAAAGAPKEN